MAEEKKMVLQASGVSIVFGGLRAVSDFDCALYEGELVGLIGPNGAGKTTVFNMLSGVYTPTEGQINYWDRRGKARVINKLNPAEHCRLGIARTFQNIRLFDSLTVEGVARISVIYLDDRDKKERNAATIASVRASAKAAGCTDEKVLKQFSDKFDLNVNLCTIADFGGWDAAYKKFFDDGAIFDEIYG